MKNRSRSGFVRLALLAGSSAVFGAGVLGVPQTKPKTKKPVTKAAAPSAPTFAKNVKPFVTKYCAPCHGAKDPVAGVSLTKYTSGTQLASAAEIWTRVGHNVRSQHMPPKGLPQPTKAERAAFLAAVDSLLVGDCKLADPGQVTLRRLNRAEYNNTVRDLLGVEFRPADDFPSDDVGYGFDNIGDVLSLSPLLMEKYLAAAEQVAAKAIPVPPVRSRVVIGPEMEVEGSAVMDDDSCDMNSVATATARFDLPQQGLYTVRVKAYGTRGGDGMPIVAVKLNGESLGDFEAGGYPAKDYEFPIKAAPGKHAVSVTFTNDFYDPKLPEDRRDRNLILKSVEIVGPQGESKPPRSLAVLKYTPPEPGQERANAENFLRRFAGRAFRRPATGDEVNRLLDLYDLSRKAREPHEKSLQLAVTAVLVSPHFLYRVEAEPKTSAKSRLLTDYELATRLSYFLWSSSPNDRLLSLAGQGKLKSPAVLEAEARRMLADPKSTALADNFAEQWLQLRKLPLFHPNPDQFPSWNEDLRASMLAETKLFFTGVLRGNRSVLEFLDAKYTYLNEPLARHYGIAGVTGPEMRKVVLAGGQRGGLLSQASVLSITSNPTRTSPVKRGKWVLENILGTPPPPPPPGVGDLGDDKKVLTTKNLRKRMEEHRKKPDCFSCHSRMDPLGFGMENYDAVGRWRVQESGEKIDSSGVLPDGRKFQGPTQLKAILLGQKDQFVHTLAERMTTYALGRGVDPSDKCFVDAVAARTRGDEYRFQTLVVEIVKSDPFRKKSLQP